MKYRIINWRFLNIICIVSLHFFSIQARPIKVACIGNSITYGSKIEDRIHDSYPAQLQQLLGENYLVGNFGKPGATLLEKGHRPYIIQEEFQQAMMFAADIVVIHLGVNDTDPRDWPNYRDFFVHDYIHLIDTLRSVNSKTTFIIANLTPILPKHPRFDSGTKQWRLQIREAISTIAKMTHTQLIDFSQALYPFPYLQPDGIHPNSKGAAKLARVVYEGITGDFGGLNMSQIYTDHMVLQRGKKIKIGGTCNRDQTVSVQFAGNKRSVVGNSQGKWMVEMDSVAVGGPYNLCVETANSQLNFQDVLVGDVWLCSGQSNMFFPVKNAAKSKEILKGEYSSNLRYINFKPLSQFKHTKTPIAVLDSVQKLQFFKKTAWEHVDISSLADLSAIGFVFGKYLQDKIDIPVGLIANSVGGSPLESWIDRNSLEQHFSRLFINWGQNDYIQPWVRSRALMNLVGNDKLLHQFKPAYLFDAAIAPLDTFAIQGVIWYQGESNAHNVGMYKELFPLFISSWRNYWKNSELPFYVVQLSSLNRPSWPWFRDAQRQLADSISNVEMIVSSDLGNPTNVHPRCKQPIGLRLAKAALAETYNFDIISTGPMAEKMTVEGPLAIISFRNGEGMHGKGNVSIKGFEIATYEGVYYPAKVRVYGDEIYLSSSKIINPCYVRYAWEPYTKANLVNSDNLPASTFRLKK